MSSSRRNRFSGTCYGCGCDVPSKAGRIRRLFGKWRVLCVSCDGNQVDRNDLSGVEDRECGLTAYEDACSLDVAGWTG